MQNKYQSEGFEREWTRYAFARWCPSARSVREFSASGEEGLPSSKTEILTRA